MFDKFKDECGVFGIFGHPEAANMTYLGLYALQHHGQIALGHNGNLVNARELRDELVGQGSIFQSSSDTEVIAHLYARSKMPTVEEALVDAVSQVQGAFSLVILTRDRLIAVR